MIDDWLLASERDLRHDGRWSIRRSRSATIRCAGGAGGRKRGARPRCVSRDRRTRGTLQAYRRDRGTLVGLLVATVVHRDRRWGMRVTNVTSRSKANLHIVGLSQELQVRLLAPGNARSVEGRRPVQTAAVDESSRGLDPNCGHSSIGRARKRRTGLRCTALASVAERARAAQTRLVA